MVPGTGGKVSLYIIILKALFCKARILLISQLQAERRILVWNKPDENKQIIIFIWGM